MFNYTINDLSQKPDEQQETKFRGGVKYIVITSPPTPLAPVRIQGKLPAVAK
jgi:hypothetical protein